MLLGDRVVVSTKVVPQEEFVTLCTGLDSVTAPDNPGSGPVFGCVRIVNSKLKITRIELICGPLCSVTTGSARLFRQFNRVAVELRVGRHPTHADRLGRQVCGVSLCPLRFLWHRCVLGKVALIPPLVAVNVMPRWRLLSAWWLCPVSCKREGRPWSDEGQFFLTDVVVHPATILSGTTCEDKRRDWRTVR